MNKAPARVESLTRLRSGLRGGAAAPLDGQPIWIHRPIADAERLSPSLEMLGYCETLRCHSKRRTATTVHALIVGHGEANLIWVACADCTGLMIEDYAT